MTAQNATDKFRGTRYLKAKGALAFYNDLNWYADRMIACPDDYTFKRKFLLGLPQDLVENLFKSWKVSAEHTPLKVLLHEVKAMESALQVIERHKHARNISLQQLRTNTPIVVQLSRTEKTVRFGSTPKSSPAKQAGIRFSGSRIKSRSSSRGQSRGPEQTKSRTSPQEGGGGSKMSHMTSGMSHQKAGSSSKDLSTKKNANITCFTCGGLGHYSNECHTKPRVFAAKVEENPASETESQAEALQDEQHH